MSTDDQEDLSPSGRHRRDGSAAGAGASWTPSPAESGAAHSHRLHAEEPVHDPDGLRAFNIGTVPASVTPPRTWRKAAWFTSAVSAAVVIGLGGAAASFVSSDSVSRQIESLPGFPRLPQVNDTGVPPDKPSGTEASSAANNPSNRRSDTRTSGASDGDRNGGPTREGDDRGDQNGEPGPPGDPGPRARDDGSQGGGTDRDRNGDGRISPRESALPLPGSPPGTRPGGPDGPGNDGSPAPGTPPGAPPSTGSPPSPSEPPAPPPDRRPAPTTPPAPEPPPPRLPDSGGPEVDDTNLPFLVVEPLRPYDKNDVAGNVEAVYETAPEDPDAALAMCGKRQQQRAAQFRSEFADLEQVRVDKVTVNERTGTTSVEMTTLDSDGMQHSKQKRIRVSDPESPKVNGEL